MKIQELNRGQLQKSIQFLVTVVKVGMAVDPELVMLSHDLI